MEHFGYEIHEDYGLCEVGRILTMEPWREKSIIASWETDGWKHLETKEFRWGKESQLQIWFIRPIEEGNE
jgi:hypothetical protein